MLLASTLKLIERVITAWHTLARLRAQSKYYACEVGLTIRPTNKSDEKSPGRTSGETFFAAIKVACPLWPCCQLSVLPNYAYVCMQHRTACVDRNRRYRGARLITRSSRPTSVSLYLCVFEGCVGNVACACFRISLSSDYWLMTNYLANWWRVVSIYHPTARRN